MGSKRFLKMHVSLFHWTVFSSLTTKELLFHLVTSVLESGIDVGMRGGRVEKFTRAKLIRTGQGQVMIFIQKWPRCQTMTPCRKFLLYKSRNELQILTLNWIVNTPPWYRKSGQNADFQGNLMFIPPIIQVSLRLWSLELNQRKSEKVNSFLKT